MITFIVTLAKRVVGVAMIAGIVCAGAVADETAQKVADRDSLAPSVDTATSPAILGLRTVRLLQK